jgi:hypothetical protein
MPLLVLPALAWATAGDAQTTNPQTMIDTQRDQVRTIVRPGCNRDEEEITVCGRPDDRGPMGPLPAIPYPPEPGRRIRGESPTNFGCMRLCHQPLTIDIFRAIRNIRRAIEERD